MAAAPVADLAAIADLPGLRYLEVTRDQWRELWHRDDLVSSLAVVGIHPEPPQREWPLGTGWAATEHGLPPRRVTGHWTTG